MNFPKQKEKKNKIKTKIEENGILHSRHQLKQSTATYKPLKTQASDRKALALSAFLTALPVVHICMLEILAALATERSAQLRRIHVLLLHKGQIPGPAAFNNCLGCRCNVRLS